MEIERTYRALHRQKDLVHFQVSLRETDLDIGIRASRYTPTTKTWCNTLLYNCRGVLEEYIQRDPGFAKSLIPYTPFPDAPKIIQVMAKAGELAGVGPMAAVAGAIASEMGLALLKHSRDVIVENGGDIYIRSNVIRRIGIFAGKSLLSYRLALEIAPEQTPLGICTSSGTVGHSLSYGCADAVVVLSTNTALADAVATATGNQIKDSTDLETAVHFATAIPGVLGALVILGDKLAVKGQIKLAPMST